jgi:hypothetical protein
VAAVRLRLCHIGCELTVEFPLAFRLINYFNYPYFNRATTRPWPLDFIPGGETEERTADRCEDGNGIATAIHILWVDKGQAEIFAGGIDAEAHRRIHGHDGWRNLLGLDNIRAVELGTEFILAWKGIGWMGLKQSFKPFQILGCQYNAGFTIHFNLVQVPCDCAMRITALQESFGLGLAGGLPEAADFCRSLQGYYLSAMAKGECCMAKRIVFYIKRHGTAIPGGYTTRK